MPRWSPLVVLLLVALIAALAYFSYQAAMSYLRWRTVKQYSTEAFTPYPPGADELDTIIAQLEAQVEKLGGDKLELMYMDLLMLRSWYRPETSVNDLHQAIAIGQKLFKNKELATCYMVRQLSYGYTAACLPAQLERWQAEVLARDPQSRHYIRFFQVYGRIISDNPGKARELIEKEVAQTSQFQATSVLALSGYLLLDDLDAAAEYAPSVAELNLQDNLFQYYYALFLQRQSNFAGALEQYRNFMGEAPEDPDDALAIAVPMAGIRGLDDPEVAALLDRATQSTRNPASREAVEAMVAYQLFEITLDNRWWHRLLELRKRAPADCQVALALAYASMLDLGNRTGSVGGEAQADRPAQNITSTHQGDALQFTQPQEYAQEAFRLARTSIDKQQSGLLLAIVYSHPGIGDDAASSSSLAESARYLRIALGDPQEEGSVEYQRVPDYEYFLLDKYVRAARAENPFYDREVNIAVVDYLNRRQEMFADIVKLPPLEYRESPETAVEDATSLLMP